MDGGFLKFLDQVVEIGEFLVIFGNHFDGLKIIILLLLWDLFIERCRRNYDGVLGYKRNVAWVERLEMWRVKFFIKKEMNIHRLFSLLLEELISNSALSLLQPNFTTSFVPFKRHPHTINSFTITTDKYQSTTPQDQAFFLPASLGSFFSSISIFSSFRLASIFASCSLILSDIEAWLSTLVIYTWASYTSSTMVKVPLLDWLNCTIKWSFYRLCFTPCGPPFAEMGMSTLK